MSQAGKYQTQIDKVLYTLNSLERELDNFCVEQDVRGPVDIHMEEVVLLNSDGATIGRAVCSEEDLWIFEPEPWFDKGQFS